MAKAKLHKYKGELMTINEICISEGIKPSPPLSKAIGKRLRSGQPIEQAIKAETREEWSPLSAATAKRLPKRKRLQLFATCPFRCNSK